MTFGKWVELEVGKWVELEVTGQRYGIVNVDGERRGMVMSNVCFTK